MALHVVYGIIIMLLLFLLCFLISFNLTQEQQRRLLAICARLLARSFVYILFFLSFFFILLHFRYVYMAIFNSRIYHCRCIIIIIICTYETRIFCSNMFSLKNLIPLPTLVFIGSFIAYSLLHKNYIEELFFSFVAYKGIFFV